MLLYRVRPPMWKLANRFGGSRGRTWSQNDQYRRGRWGYLADGRRARLTELVEQLAGGGRVVEHACGEGHLAAQVNPGSYLSYQAYDISDVAIAAARARGLPGHCRFEVLDFTAWAGDTDLSLIVVEECLNYLRPAQLGPFLDRCRASLGPGGAVLATFHDPSLYPAAVAECRARFPRHEEISDGPSSLYLVLRP
jgi:trans-aconitate methyltransferase